MVKSQTNPILNLKGANENTKNTNLNVDGQDIDKVEVVTVDFQENVFKYPGDDFEFTEENLEPDQKLFEFETRHYVLETISLQKLWHILQKTLLTYSS